MRHERTAITAVTLLAATMVANAEPSTGASSARSAIASGISSDPDDPDNLRLEAEERAQQRDSLVGVSPLGWLHDGVGEFSDSLHEATGLRLSLAINHVFQTITESRPGTDKDGMATDLDLVGAWELINRGQPNRGQFVFGIEGRWDYDTTGPQELGFVSLGSQIGTANAFSKYTPAFILRNLYWEQGSVEAGWAVRFGKITPDAILSTSRHMTPLTTFLSNAGTGFFSNGLPDSGLGAVGVFHPTDRFRILGLVSDSNANRMDFGAPGYGDFYKALEVGYQIAPQTEKAGYSKLTVWQNDGTDNGAPVNGSTGRSGWGYSIKLENELSADGKAIGLLRWGQSFNKSAAWTLQFGAAFLYYDPSLIGRISNDVAGVAFNWLDPTIEGARDEYSVEAFYRFPLFPSVDTSLSYQAVFDPALNPDDDFASVFSLRLRTTF